MAEQGNRQGESKAAPAAPVAGRRQMVAMNVAVASLLVAGLVVAVNYIAWWLDQRYDIKADLTEGSRLSFSSRTRVTLEKLTGPVRLTSFFVADDKDAEAQLRKRRVQDLLRQYEASAGNVEAIFIDPREDDDKLQSLGRRILALHEKETAPYVDAVRSDLEIEVEFLALLAAEAELFDKAAAEGEVSAEVKQFLQTVTFGFRSQAGTHQQLVDSLKKQFGEELALKAAETLEGKSGGLGIPPYSGATSKIREVTNDTARFLAQVALGAEEVVRVEGAKLSDASKQTLSGSKQRYEAIQKSAADMITRLDALKPLELDTLLAELDLNIIIIEAAGQIRVAGFNELWPSVPGQESADPTARRAFVGENVVTSALLAMSMQDKPTALVTVWNGPMVNEYQGQFTEIARRLKRANFQIRTWDVAREPDMPKPEGKGPVVLMVLAPGPANPQMPWMTATPQMYESVRKFLADGGAAMFFCPLNVGSPMPTPYLGILGDFGIGVNDAAATVVCEEMPGGDKYFSPVFNASRYPREGAPGAPHAIVAPLQGMASGFYIAVPVQAADPLPEGVQVRPLVEVPDDGKCWAESNLMKLDSKREAEFDEGEDVGPPYAIAVAAVRETVAEDGRKAESRVVAFGSFLFASDRLAGTTVDFGPRGIEEYYPNPGNGELVTNGMLWLAGLEDLIAVSPEAYAAHKIRPLDSGPRNTIRWVLWGGMPLAVVLLGIVVYFVRSRVR